jgi:hypothetical protein
MGLRESSSSVRTNSTLTPHPTSCHLTPSYPLCTAGEILAQPLSQLERDIQPVVVISACTKALHKALHIVQKISTPINTSDDDEMLAFIKTSTGSKFVVRWSELMCELALKAVSIVAQDEGGSGTRWWHEDGGYQSVCKSRESPRRRNRAEQSSTRGSDLIPFAVKDVYSEFSRYGHQGHSQIIKQSQ